MFKISSTKDLLMLMLYVKGHRGEECEPIHGRTRLMKMMFLFKEEVWRDFNRDKSIRRDVLPNFEAYDFGPFSVQIYSDLDFLLELGFIEVRYSEDVLEEDAAEYRHWEEKVVPYSEENAPLFQEAVFSLTELGREFIAGGQLGEITQAQWEILEEFKARCTGVHLRSLLRYVYSRYPKLTTESKIRDKIMSTYRF